MKRLSLWLFKIFWKREIAKTYRMSSIPARVFGPDYHDGFLSGVEYALETLLLKERT